MSYAAVPAPTPLVFLEWLAQGLSLLAVSSTGEAFSITPQRPPGSARTTAMTVSAWQVQLVWSTQGCPGVPPAPHADFAVQTSEHCSQAEAALYCYHRRPTAAACHMLACSDQPDLTARCLPSSCSSQPACNAAAAALLKSPKLWPSAPGIVQPSPASPSPGLGPLESGLPRRLGAAWLRPWQSCMATILPAGVLQVCMPSIAQQCTPRRLRAEGPELVKCWLHAPCRSKQRGSCC